MKPTNLLFFRYSFETLKLIALFINDNRESTVCYSSGNRFGTGMFFSR